MSVAGRGGDPVGILGGTFDPPHLAHLAIAEEAREVLSLTRVLFIPAGEPWQKAGRAVTPRQLRAEMVRRAIVGNPAFVLDTREVDRPGPTYTADTLEALAAEGVAVDPWLILSSETLAGFATWRDPSRILGLARLCIVPRLQGPRGSHADGSGASAADTRAALAGDGPRGVVDAFRARFDVADERVILLDGPRLAISSTDIRARVRAGRSIRYLVPDAVAALVAEYALYPAEAASVAAPAIR